MYISGFPSLCIQCYLPYLSQVGCQDIVRKELGGYISYSYVTICTKIKFMINIIFVLSCQTQTQHSQKNTQHLFPTRSHTREKLSHSFKTITIWSHKSWSRYHQILMTKRNANLLDFVPNVCKIISHNSTERKTVVFVF